MATNSTPHISVSSLDHAWVHTVAEWTNPKRHDEMFRLASMHNAWVWVAKRYKEYLEMHAGDAVAHTQLQRIQRGSLLLSIYAAGQTEKKRPMPYRKTVSMLVMMCLALGIGSLYTAALPTTEVPNDSIAIEMVDYDADEDIVAFASK